MVFETVNGQDHLPEEEDEQSYPEIPQEQLLKMITELPPGYRTVFNFYVMENYSHREIAELLGCSESTSKTQLLKARAWLRQRIHEHLKHAEYGQKTSSAR